MESPKLTANLAQAVEGVELDVIEALDRPRSLEDLAAQIEASPEATQAAVAALLARGMLTTVEVRKSATYSETRYELYQEGRIARAVVMRANRNRSR